MKKFLKSKKGISPIISTILIFSILMTGVIITYSWGLPLVLNFQDKSEVNDITNQFYELDRNVKIVVHEGDDATRSTQFELNRGLLNHTSSSNLSLILVSDDETYEVIDANDLDAKRMAYFVRSSMDDLAINSSSALTGAVDAYPIVNVTQGAHDAGLYAAFEEADQNRDISRIVYTRPESSQYSLYLEYRPMLIIRAQESGGEISRVDIELYLIRLDNAGSFPAVGATKITVKRIIIDDTVSGSSSPTFADPNNVSLYALVDGKYQQLTLDFQVTGGFSLNWRIITTEMKVYTT